MKGGLGGVTSGIAVQAFQGQCSSRRRSIENLILTRTFAKELLAQFAAQYLKKFGFVRSVFVHALVEVTKKTDAST